MAKLFQTEAVLSTIKLQTTQPCLLALGPEPNAIMSYFMALNKEFFPIEATNIIEALIQLFKCHYVFETAYDSDLANFFKFIAVTFYGLYDNKSLTPHMQEISRLIL